MSRNEKNFRQEQSAKKTACALYLAGDLPAMDIKMTIKEKNGFTQRDNNDIAGLGWINKFKWLRSVELGRLMWPNDKHSRRRIDRVIVGWLAYEYVIERKLPGGAGRCFVLSEAGARLLLAVKTTARTGKDFGKTSPQGWRPGLKWRHDLIVAGVLTHLHEQGFTIMSEPQIRRENPDLGKIPDGLAWKDGIVYCVEVEQSVKKGESQKTLAESICVVSEGTYELISKRRPTAALVAFDIDARDTRDLVIDHKARVKNAIQRVSVRDVNVTWAACTLAGQGVSAVAELETEIVPSNLASKIALRLESSGWVMGADDVYRVTYGGYQMQVWDATEDAGSWVAAVADEAVFAYKDTKAQAQRACADFLAERPSSKK